MKELQKEINRIRLELLDLTHNSTLQYLPDQEKILFYKSIKLLNDFEDNLIFKIINK
jgi:hypothetical protein